MWAEMLVFDLDDTMANTTRDLQGDLCRIEEHLTLVVGVKEFFAQSKIKKLHRVLLTMGDIHAQERKIKTLNIGSYFKSICVTRTPAEKEAALDAILRASRVLRRKSVVIGDRLDSEIRAGNKLGCVTVRMRIKGAKRSVEEAETIQDTPTYVVEDFFELARLPLFA